MSALLNRRGFLKVMGLSASSLTIPGGISAAQRSAGSSAKHKPNILWLTCEDIGPNLGCYGDSYAGTPNLDSLAEEGVLFRNAFATASVCAPARSCLITGIYATSLGTQHLRSQIKLPEQITCFSEYLREAGYYCSNNYKQDYNFVAKTAWHESSKMAHWRNREPGQPFFAVFNSVTTHQSQIDGPDERFFAKYTSNLKPGERHDPANVPLPPYYPDTPIVREARARYYDLITLMDKEVGYLLQQLEDDGLAENTIVFFFSDHGLGLPRFKRTLYDSGLHVPLIVRFPARYRHLAPVKPGETVDELVSFVDFAPTVLSLAGLPVPKLMQGRVFLGKGVGAPRRYVFGASSRVDEAYELSRCVRDARYKYIRNYMPHLPYAQLSAWPDQARVMKELRRLAAEGKLVGPQAVFARPRKPVEELYDTQADPHEIRNQVNSAQHSRILERMRRVHKRWMTDTLDLGLLPEAEMHIRAEGRAPYEMAREPGKYPQERILAAAEFVGKGPENLPKLIGILKDSDSAVRY
ncbi:sulfatase, partial [bacterium]|nr:sulfatase [bacterium]